MCNILCRLVVDLLQLKINHTLCSIQILSRGIILIDSRMTNFRIPTFKFNKPSSTTLLFPYKCIIHLQRSSTKDVILMYSCVRRQFNRIIYLRGLLFTVCAIIIICSPLKTNNARCSL